jgi:hypothetical protein
LSAKRTARKRSIPIGMGSYSKADVEWRRKVQEVTLRALAKKTAWRRPV